MMQTFIFFAVTVLGGGLYLYNWRTMKDCAEHYELGAVADSLWIPPYGWFKTYLYLYFGVFMGFGWGIQMIVRGLNKYPKWGEFEYLGHALSLGVGVPLILATVLMLSNSPWWREYKKYTELVALWTVLITKPRQTAQSMLYVMPVWYLGYIFIPAAIYGYVVLSTAIGAFVVAWVKEEKTGPISLLKTLRSLGYMPNRTAPVGAPVEEAPSKFSLHIGVATGAFAERKHTSAMKANQSINFSQKDAAINTLVFGGIGSGKTTRVINNLMFQLFRHPTAPGGLIFDIKSDFKREVNYFALPEQGNRKITTIGVGGNRPINLLKGLSPEMCGTFLKSAFLLESNGSSDNAYWIDNAVNLAVGSLNILKHFDYSLSGLYNYIFIESYRKDINAKASREVYFELMKKDPAEAEMLRSHIGSYDMHFGTLDGKTRGLIESTVSTVLVGFARNAAIKKAFCEDREDAVDMTSVLDGEILLVDLPLPIFGSTAKVTYMWIKLLWMNIMQQRKVQTQWDQDRPVFFLCDEYQSIIAANKNGVSDLTFWDKSRSSGAIGIISMQHISSLYAAIGNKDVANTIMANFRQKICFRTEDETTLNYFNRMLGKVELSRVTESSGSSSNNQGDSSSYNLSTQHYHQDILDAQMMRGLGNDRAVAMLNIDNISCDDVIALKPRYMPEDWQIPSTTA